MRFQIILCLSLLATGCSTKVPVKVTWPEAPPALMETCPSLKTIDKSEVKLSELMSTVVHNYTQYHQCSDLVKVWQEWYKTQRDVFNTIGSDK